MNFTDYLWLAFNSITTRSTRSYLTIIGILIGIAAVVALISLGQGLTVAIEEQFSAIGGDKVFVVGKSGGMGPPGILTAGKIYEKDSKYVERVSGVNEIANSIYHSITMEFNREIQTQFAISVPNDEGIDLAKEAQVLEAEKGRHLTKKDHGKVVLGIDLANDYFGKEVRVGNKILMNGVKYEVIGINKRVGDPGIDGGASITSNDMYELVDDLEPEEVSVIYVRVDKGQNPEDVADRIEKTLRKKRGEKEGEETFDVQTFTEALETFGAIFNIVTAILIGIAAISLIVGGVGIMNTMYTAVVERTVEIGIMKSLGARDNHIMTLFVVEAGMLGMAGGILGVLIGGGFSKLIEIVATAQYGSPLINVHYPMELIIGAILFSFIVGMISGFFPARQAALQNPVDSLRYE